jgi:tyrosyl-tRNA synthetase
MFGKLMSIPDELMENYFTLLTDRDTEEVKSLLAGHPRQAKAALARDVVAFYHGEEAARSASDQFDRVFAEKQRPTDIPEVTVPATLTLPDLVVQCEFASSKGEAKRLIAQGGVSINDEKLTDSKTDLTINDGDVLRVGKRRFATLRVS